MTPKEEVKNKEYSLVTLFDRMKPIFQGGYSECHTYAVEKYGYSGALLTRIIKTELLTPKTK